MEALSSLPNLRILGLPDSDLKNEDCETIARNARNLRELRLEYNVYVDNSGVKHFGDYVTALETLNVAFTGIDCKPFFTRLSEDLALFPRLVALVVYYKSATRSLESSRPKLKIYGFKAF